MTESLAEKTCTPCRGGVPPLPRDEALRFQAQAPDWELRDDARRIERIFRFRNFREALAFVRKSAVGVWHASCSCRMGRTEDPMAVVDTQGRVKGVQGLRVVDASIFPVVPCANTNFPVLMTAEKIADAMQ